MKIETGYAVVIKRYCEGDNHSNPSSFLEVIAFSANKQTAKKLAKKESKNINPRIEPDYVYIHQAVMVGKTVYLKNKRLK